MYVVRIFWKTFVQLQVAVGHHLVDPESSSKKLLEFPDPNLSGPRDTGIHRKTASTFLEIDDININPTKFGVFQLLEIVLQCSTTA